MSEPLPPEPQNSSLSAPAKIGWGILIGVTLFVCYFSHLGAIGFVGPDEPRYAWIARAMAETGDWVTPRLYGQPWFEKPPLFYWGAALSFKLFGVSEAAARLPSAICALLATLAVGWLAGRIYGADTARWLLLLLPTSVGMIGFSHAAATDMPFSAMLTAAMVCAAIILGLIPMAEELSPSTGTVWPAPTAAGAARRTPWAALLLFGFFLGLAVLAKGPAGIVLGAGAVFFWALITNRWGDAFRLFHPAAMATFSVTALPWYILCARRNPDFLGVFIVEHNFKRYLTPEFQHLQPFWFYVPVVFVALLPWTLLLFSSALSALSANRPGRNIPASSWFFACWSGFCIAFFTLSRSKLPGYILPAVPALGVLLTRDLCGKLRQRVGNLRWLGFGVGLTLVVLGVAAALEGEKIPFVTDIRPAPAVVQLYCVMVLAGTTVGILSVLRRVRAALVIASLTLPFFLVFGTRDLWTLDEGISARPVAVTAKTEFPAELLQDAATYKLQRSLIFALNFYFRKQLPQWQPPGGRRGIVFTSPNGSEELRTRIACWQYLAPPAVEICADGVSATSLVRRAAGGGQLE